MSNEKSTDLLSQWFAEPVEVVEHAVEVLGLLSFDEFQEIQRLTGRPQERHKSWATHYIWSLREGQDPGPALAYLKTLNVHYHYTQALRWRGRGDKCQQERED